MPKTKQPTTTKKPIAGQIAFSNSPNQTASNKSTTITKPNHPKMVTIKRAKIYNI